MTNKSICQGRIISAVPPCLKAKPSSLVFNADSTDQVTPLHLITPRCSSV